MTKVFASTSTVSVVYAAVGEGLQRCSPRRGGQPIADGPGGGGVPRRGRPALAGSVGPDLRRVPLEACFSRLWRLPAFSRRILPEPVTRKRLLAPECVLFFGISFSFLC